MWPHGEIRGVGLGEIVVAAMRRMSVSGTRGIYPGVTGLLVAAPVLLFPFTPLLFLLLFFPSHGLV